MNKGQVIRVIDKGGKLGSCGRLSPRVAIIEEKGYPKYLMLDNAKMDKFELLALAVKVAQKDERQAWGLMQLASQLFHPQNDWVFDTLYDSVAMDITRKKMYESSEYWLHGYFKKNVKSILGDHVDLVDGPKHQNHQPDAWIKIKGELIPVEIKRGNFNQKALNQLMRYIKAFEAKRGIAIARELTTELPANIIFVSCADWRNQE